MCPNSFAQKKTAADPHHLHILETCQRRCLENIKEPIARVPVETNTPTILRVQIVSIHLTMFIGIQVRADGSVELLLTKSWALLLLRRIKRLLSDAILACEHANSLRSRPCNGLAPSSLRSGQYLRKYGLPGEIVPCTTAPLRSKRTSHSAKCHQYPTPPSGGVRSGRRCQQSGHEATIICLLSTLSPMLRDIQF